MNTEGMANSKLHSINDKIFHNSFEIGILIKGLDGILEIIGGFLLMFINHARLDKIVTLLTQHELLDDPHDLFANFILRINEGFSVSTQHFGIFYLLLHGAVKVILVVLLRKGKLWAYPLEIIFLLMFIGIQMTRYMQTHSIWLIILTVFDMIMIFLTLIEYRRIKSTKNA